MDSAREKLTAASHKLAEQMYKATQARARRARAPVRTPGPTATSGGNGQASRRKTKA